MLQGDFCTNCGAPFLRSFTTFEVLPLVEFELETGISDAEAAALIGEDVLGTAMSVEERGVELGPDKGGDGANVLRLDDDDAAGGIGAMGLARGMAGPLEDSFAAQVRITAGHLLCYCTKAGTHSVTLPRHAQAPQPRVLHTPATQAGT